MNNEHFTVEHVSFESLSIAMKSLRLVTLPKFSSLYEISDDSYRD